MSAPPEAGWLSRHLPALRAAGTSVLDLGCGPGRDCAFLSAEGFRVTGCDRYAAALARARIAAPAAAYLRLDIARPLPFRSGTFDAAIASLSLHYLPWVETLAAVAEVRRVLRPGGLFLFRVNASDDVNFGAGRGEEVEPGLFRVDGEPGRWSPVKRFFDAAMVHAMAAGAFEIERLEHRAIDREGVTKRIWECLARRD
ncbi:MAG: class I SAM-dependent methyltransferase [Chloroflexi bacterium]|nr:class I SAM-dependent methyltransferase [Chloroflexota bacterium]